MGFLRRLFCRHWFERISPRFVVEDREYCVYRCEKCDKTMII